MNLFLLSLYATTTLSALINHYVINYNMYTIITNKYISKSFLLRKHSKINIHKTCILNLSDQRAGKKYKDLALPSSASYFQSKCLLDGFSISRKFFFKKNFSRTTVFHTYTPTLLFSMEGYYIVINYYYLS